MKQKLTPTNIEWADYVWNPMSGCTKISDGCKNCYAADMAKRLQRIQETTGKDLGYADGFAVTLHPERLEAPLNHKKPAKIFVNSMGDLFHESVPLEFIESVFFAIGVATQHTYQILTKRPERMKKVINYLTYKGVSMRPNVWLGVTAENQEQADERIPILLDTPEALRFVSVEPMFDEINLDGLGLEWGGSYYGTKCTKCGNAGSSGIVLGCCEDDIWCGECGSREHIEDLPTLDWVIIGGETGANARPMHPDWVRSIQKQCEEAKVPFFFKQWGEYKTLPQGKSVTGYKSHFWEDGRQAVRVGKKQAGHLLDGVEYREMPEVKNEK